MDEFNNVWSLTNIEFNESFEFSEGLILWPLQRGRGKGWDGDHHKKDRWGW